MNSNCSPTIHSSCSAAFRPESLLDEAVVFVIGDAAESGKPSLESRVCSALGRQAARHGVSPRKQWPGVQVCDIMHSSTAQCGAARE
jgi:hypothetical protein